MVGAGFSPLHLDSRASRPVGTGLPGDWATDNIVAHSFYRRNRILSSSTFTAEQRLGWRKPLVDKTVDQVVAFGITDLPGKDLTGTLIQTVDS